VRSVSGGSTRDGHERGLRPGRRERGASGAPRIYLSPPDVGAEERRLLLEAFDSNWIAPVGPQVDAFERELAAAVEVPHAVALSSGTAALHLALHVLGVGAGDEVLLPTLTFAASANAVHYVGATPAFIDVSPETWTLDPDLLADELALRGRRGRPPAAVLTVDLYGQCADYAVIERLCDEHEVPIVEDAAEALGASCGARKAGAFGRCAAFSFNGNKIITTSGGGMLVSRDARLIERARHLATQARDPAPHYEHSEIGFNYRMSNLLAAVGRGQLRSLTRKLDRRRAINESYRRGLEAEEGVTVMPEAPYGRSNFWLTCILIEPSLFGATREDVRQHLDSHGIESRPAWKPMHLQPVFRGCRVRGGAVAERLFETGLCLPSGSSLTEEDQAFVVATLRQTPRAGGRSARVGSASWAR
jgi:dTDP-4-amino-4,6-dideoxygalactose transaminase